MNITARMLANIEQNGIGSVGKEDLQVIEKLTVEFADELALLGVKVTALEEDMKSVKEDVAVLKNDVSCIKSAIKNGTNDNVKLSTDILVRNYGFVHDRGSLGGMDFGEDHRHRTESILRLQMDTAIDEKVSARVRWDVIGNNGNNEWNGGNKNTARVKKAYIIIKDMFDFGGVFKFGRDKFLHGHGFVIYDYMDAVNYTKKCGDVNLTLNLFLERQGNKDSYNIWNINTDYSYKGHDMYFGFYYNDRAYDKNGVAYEDNRKEIRYEFGSYGKLTNKNDKYTYDLGLVYSDIEDGNGQGDNAQGLLGHFAFSYDSKKEFGAKLSYTYADDESKANIKVSNLNAPTMSYETIFDDLYLVSLAADAGTNKTFQNLRDYKLQLFYKLKNNNSHSFRLAYDYLENIYDGRANTFNTVAGNPLVGFINDLKGNVITFTYSYQLSKHTRLKVGYQNAKVKASNMPDQKVDFYFTELFSKF